MTKPRAIRKGTETARLDKLSRELLGLASQAVETLQGVMSSNEASAGIKVRCAEIVLSNLLRIKELHEFEARLAALEKGNSAQNQP